MDDLTAEQSAAAVKVADNDRELMRLGKSILSVKSLLSTAAKKLGQDNERLLTEKGRLIEFKRAARRQAEWRVKAQAAQLRALCLTRQAAARTKCIDKSGLIS